MTEQYDVIVAGGGSAGIAAAIGARRAGARTLLVERGPCLGGSATLRNVVTYCGIGPGPSNTTRAPASPPNGGSSAIPGTTTYRSTCCAVATPTTCSPPDAPSTATEAPAPRYA
jgi:cation diffusion facilitator CzcD-associated flavoprotein CzcO